VDEKIKAALERDAFIYPPMEHFVQHPHDPASSMRMLILRCELLSARENRHHHSLERWLSSIRQRRDIAFHGSVMNDPFKAGDIDILAFNPWASAPLPPAPPFLHAFSVFNPEVERHAPLFLAGPLLFPDSPDTSLLRRIEAERAALLGKPFFDGGFGEIITHAIFKESKAHEGLNGGPPAAIRFSLKSQWFDGTNMRMVPYTPHEHNEQIRQQVRELEDADVRTLAISAMRRIRVKEAKREALADKFVAELRRSAPGLRR